MAVLYLKTQLSTHLNALLDPEVVSHGLPVLRAGDIQKPLINFPFHGGIKHLKELCSDVRLRAAKAWEEGWLQFGCDVASRKALISTRWKTVFNVKTSAHRNITNHLFSLSQLLCRLPCLNAIAKKHSSHYTCVFKAIYVEPLLLHWSLLEHFRYLVVLYSYWCC